MTAQHDDTAGQGVGTTGHEWDGIKEYNNPLPRWWLWTLYATLIWGLGYWIVMPSWPTFWGYTKGFLGYSQRSVVTEELAAAQASKAALGDAVLQASLQEIEGNPQLLEFALAAGGAAFGDNCATCHGTGAEGTVGYPNLNDDDWLWGGTLDDIHHTILFGIRSGHDEGRENDMPAFLSDEILTPEEVAGVTNYVLALSGAGDIAAVTDDDVTVYVDNCSACHGEDGAGDPTLGAPDLTDGIWLYGGTPEAVRRSIARSRRGVMPAWQNRLDALTVKSLAVYVHALGGGE